MPEPARGPARLVLRWGAARERIVLGLALVLAGGAAVAGSSVYVLWLAGLGTLAAVAGWAIQPADGWRRVVAAAVATPATWLLITGPHFLGALVVPYLAWMLVRRRPPLAWLTVLLPAGAAFATGQLFPDYADMLAALGVMIAAMVVAAWGAAALDRTPRG